MSSTRQLKVFVVDDHKTVALTLSTILQQSGFSAVAFTSPLEALRTVSADAPDLLISDIVMTEMSGVDLALRWQAIYPNCKILFLSGSIDAASLLDVVRESGQCVNLLNKPVHPTDLLRMIRDLFADPNVNQNPRQSLLPKASTR